MQGKTIELMARLSFSLLLVVGLSACSSSSSNLKPSSGELQATQWKLLQLGTRSVTSADYQTDPHIVFLPDQKRVAGSGGCNRLMGSYELKADQLRFSQLAGTMMACVKGMDTEQRFQRMMESVSGWKIQAGRLELFDAAGNVVAVFEPYEKQ